MKSKLLLIGLLLCLCGCTRVSVPKQYVDILTTIKIDPDYRDIKISDGTAPLRFRILDDADRYVTCISGMHNDTLVYDDRNIAIDGQEWRELLDGNKGNEITIVIYLKKDGVWYKYPVIKNYVFDYSDDEDRSYRIIKSSDVIYYTIAATKEDGLN